MVTRITTSAIVGTRARSPRGDRTARQTSSTARVPASTATPTRVATSNPLPSMVPIMALGPRRRQGRSGGPA